jgi:HD-GYP domain-containing protein (c-di-GMP phosphodiesterase class II)
MNELIGVVAMLTAAMQPSEIRAHCRRVADLSKKLARELRLPAKRLALVHAIGILHEIDGIDAITRSTPLEFAILGVADSFDTLTNGGEALQLDEAIEEIRREAGTRFSPAVVKALMKLVRKSEGEKNNDS